jgi:NADP-dependent 3-hydroxy acid dehydrogenase YdfG/acyl carrier protein
VQQWLTEDLLSPARLVVMTRGAVAIGPREGVADLAAAAVWGLVRAAQAENPDRLLLADLPPEGSAVDTDALQVLAAASGSGEAELAVRDKIAYGRRLIRLAGAADPEPDPAAYRSPGTVLVTGGTGMLGGLVAGHLASTGRASAIILASRSGPAAPGGPALAASLANRGAYVQVTACDTSGRAALAGLLAQVPANSPLTAVVHTAGIADDGVIGSLTPARVDAVMRPKADAAWHLHELTQDAGLQAFILFSSAAATFGGSGQANYAAANAFLDALASYRRATGLPATSLAWGLWADASAISGHLSDADRARIARSGMGALTAEEGLSLFDMALAADDAAMVLMQVDSAVLSGRGDPWQLPALLRGLIYPHARRVAEAGHADSGAATLRERLASAAAADQNAIVLDLLLPHAAAVLGYGSPTLIEADREFHELGFDSLTAIELRNQLNATTGLRLSATLVFDYPTPAILAGYIRREILRDGVSSSALALEEIGKLERIVQNVPSDDGARADLTIRLRTLLSALEGGRDIATEDDDLKAATAENIFELLDQELEES